MSVVFTIFICNIIVYNLIKYGLPTVYCHSGGVVVFPQVHTADYSQILEPLGEEIGDIIAPGRRASRPSSCSLLFSCLIVVERFC